ncbi:hypothetical protein T439DRAFT_69812 [Meredithblackwellia eburnea MCA 4105]
MDLPQVSMDAYGVENDSSPQGFNTAQLIHSLRLGFRWIHTVETNKRDPSCSPCARCFSSPLFEASDPMPVSAVIPSHAPLPTNPSASASASASRSLGRGGQGPGTTGGGGRGLQTVGFVGERVGAAKELLVEVDPEDKILISYHDKHIDPSPRLALRCHFQHSTLPFDRENPYFRDTPPPGRLVLSNESLDQAGSAETEGLRILSLFEHVGDGMTAQAWRVAPSSSSLNRNILTQDNPPLVAKVVSYRHAAYVARETMMYEKVLEEREEVVGQIPQFFGTFMSPCGGWFVMLMEDVGTTLPSESGEDWPSMDEEEWFEIEELKQSLLEIGVAHGDWRPANVAKRPDGSFAVLDFGYSYFV